MEYPSVAFVSAETTPPSANWTRYHSLGAFLDQGTADIVLLDQPRSDATASVATLRRRPDFRYALIYTRDDAVPLSDGPIPDEPEKLVPRFRLWRERMAMFNRGQAPERFDERVLAWLWTRPSARLEPTLSPQFRELYDYPVLSTMATDEPVNEMLWLNLMAEQGWLERRELVDRIRLCTRCSSGHLNYVDVCPDCHDLDIVRQPSLHCFTCGHVAPQEHFLKEGLMICPNCLSRLRHIGSDYDRPLENYRCQKCQSFFVDADVEARCLECGEHHEPGELKIREIRPFQLSETGRLRCRQGFAEHSLADQFGRLNLIGSRAFRTLLDWEIQQVRRYPDTPSCSLLVLRFEEFESLSGDARGMALLDSLVERIQEAIRDTDRCTRTREDLLWLLLPHTDSDGAGVLRSRLSQLTQLFHENDDFRTRVRLASFTIPTDLLKQEDARLLMARLEGEVS